MIDFCLKATDEAAAISALSSFRGVDENGNGYWITSTHQWALDVIGTVYHETGKTVSIGVFTIPVEEPSAGFHLNLRLIDESLAPMIQDTGLVIQVPAEPKRVWA